MSFALLYAVVRFLLDALLTRRQSASRLEAEVLALRHQLRVLQRQVRRPCWQPADRVYLSALSRLLPGPSWSSLLTSRETLLRWHRELVRRRWATYRSRPRRWQSADRETLRETAVRLAQENPIKLGMRCSHLTVLRILPRHGLQSVPRRSQRSSQSFIRQHANQMLACDFFVVDTSLAHPALGLLLHRDRQPLRASGWLHLHHGPALRGSSPLSLGDPSSRLRAPLTFICRRTKNVTVHPSAVTPLRLGSTYVYPSPMKESVRGST